MAGNPFQAPNPQAFDPYPIEAPLAKDDTPHAYNLLGLYRAERRTAGQDYANQLAASHEGSRQQLLAEIQNNNAKHLIDATGKPGAVGLLAGLPQYGGLFGPGANPDAINEFHGQQTRLQNATIANTGAEGVYKLEQAGMPTNPGEATRITGLQTTQGVPLAIREQLAKPRPPKPEQQAIPMYVGTLGGQPIHYPVKQVYGSTPEQQAAHYKEAIDMALLLYPGLKVEPGLNPAFIPPGSPGSTQRLPATTPGAPTTSLPPRPQAQAPTPQTTAASPAPTAVASPTQSGGTTAPPTQQPAQAPALPSTPAQIIRTPKLQQNAWTYVRTMDEKTRKDIGAALSKDNLGTTLPIYPDGRGGYEIRGLEGKYPIGTR